MNDDRATDRSDAPAVMKQGHAYTHRGQRVLALESGEAGMVGVISDGSFSSRHFALATDLVALPMAYYRNEVPR